MTKSVTSTMTFSWMATRFPCRWIREERVEVLGNSSDTDQAFFLQELNSYWLVKPHLVRKSASDDLQAIADMWDALEQKVPTGWVEVESPKIKLLEDIGRIHDDLKNDRLSEARLRIETVANSVTPHAIQHFPSTVKPSNFRAWADTCWIIGEYLYAVSILDSEGVAAATKYVKEQLREEADGGLAWDEEQNTTVLVNNNPRLREYPPVCWNNNEFLQICKSLTENSFKDAIFASLIHIFNLDTKFFLQDVYSAIQQGYKPNLPEGQTMRMWADSGIRGMAAYCLAMSIQKADKIVLCEGCGLPLVRTRSDRTTHRASCRKQKQRNVALGQTDI